MERLNEVRILSIQVLENSVIITLCDESGNLYTERVAPELWAKINQVFIEYDLDMERQRISNIRHIPQYYAEGETEHQVLSRLTDLETMLLDAMEYEEMMQAIEQLADTQKRRLKMYLLDGMTYRQIADKEGVIIPAVQQSIQIAIHKLKKIFKNRL